MPVKPVAHIANLDPYSITAQDPWLSTEREHIRKMDWNEGKGPSSFLQRVLSDAVNSPEYLNWYPDYNATELSQAIGKFLNSSPLNLLTFPGSDVALEAICRVYLTPDDPVVMVTPSYENFRVFAKSCGAQVTDHHIDRPFNFDIHQLIAELKKTQPKMVYITNPNNPCGYPVAKDDIEKLCFQFHNTLFIVDEAYIEFSEFESSAPLAISFDNLIVARTFSKAFSMAGMRLGYVIANHEILKHLAKVRNGKNITMLTQKLGISCLENFDQIETYIQEVQVARNWLSEQLSIHNIVNYPSQGNFILFEVSSPKFVCAELKPFGIYIRDRSEAIKNGLRVTLTNQQDAEYFLKALLQVVK